MIYDWRILNPNGSSATSTIAINSDGSKAIAAYYNGRVWLYSDGVWTETQPAGAANKSWSMVAISLDGSTMLAGISSGRLYLYSEGSWSETQPAGAVNKQWWAGDINGDGSRMVVAAREGRLYKYVSGTWSETKPAGSTDYLWTFCKIDNSGYKMFAGFETDDGGGSWPKGRIYRFESGSWSETRPAGDVDHNWKNGCLSKSGSIMAVMDSKPDGSDYDVDVYLYSGGAWTKIAGDVVNAGIESLDDSGGILALPVYGDSVRIYSNSSWENISYFDDFAQKYFSSCSISGDGATLMVRTTSNVYLGKLSSGSSQVIWW